MRCREMLVTLVLLLAFALVVPAHALVVNGIDCVILGKTSVKLDDGGFLVDGSVCVNDPGGLLRIGAHNAIRETIADKTFFGTGAAVDVCRFNRSTGGRPAIVCATESAISTLPLTPWPPLPAPVVTPCAPDVTVAPGATVTLAPGCRRDVRVRDGGTLLLSAGRYAFRSMTLEHGATLEGNGATVDLKGALLTEAGATIDNVSVTTIADGTFEAINVGSGSSVINSLLYAPFARMRLHLGITPLASEFVASFVTAQPFTIAVDNFFGACIGQIQKSGSAIILTDGNRLNGQGLSFFVSRSCAIDPSISCPGPDCARATLQIGPTNTTAALDLPGGLSPRDYHVIVSAVGGAFCSSATVPLP